MMERKMYAVKRKQQKIKVLRKVRIGVLELKSKRTKGDSDTTVVRDVQEIGSDGWNCS